MKRRTRLSFLCLLIATSAWLGGCGLLGDLDDGAITDAGSDTYLGDSSGNSGGGTDTPQQQRRQRRTPPPTLPDSTDSGDTAGTENLADPRLSRLHRVSNFCASAATGTRTAEGEPVAWQAQSGPSTVGSGQTIASGPYRMESGLNALSIIPTASLLFCGDGIVDGQEACDSLQSTLTCEDYGWDLGNAQCTNNCIADLTSCTFMFTQLDVISPILPGLTCGLRPKSPDTTRPRSNITCWPDDTGRNGFKLPDRDDRNTPSPSHFKVLATFLDPATGTGHACAITESGETLAISRTASGLAIADRSFLGTRKRGFCLNPSYAPCVRFFLCLSQASALGC